MIDPDNILKTFHNVLVRALNVGVIRVLLNRKEKFEIKRNCLPTYPILSDNET